MRPLAGIPTLPVHNKKTREAIVMTTRRDFLKAGATATAGIVFCGCGMVHNANAQQPRRKLPVSVDGKRVKTIDIHSHCHFREAGALLGADAGKYQLPPVNGAAEAFIEIDKRLAAMDSQASIWKCFRSTRSGTTATAISPGRSSISRMKSSPNSAPRSPSASRPSPR
ncbi:twin-arginine translocation signal domain-containing protein [Bradyrhizobium sp. CCBAU 53421]|uniref:twin-arginine translocation signal domain-containing protein n=1 Tax=Bradyrhizobium sp. CCBAU 53421 TaxID=1325120 RepID=UPI001FEDF170|nr:twin-arginine translocation signal domain-containing protein [Bradyrhizobium sp. CCBAU 53421]